MIEKKKKKSYRPKKENEIRLKSYLIKKDGEYNKLGERISG
jgi:hypothetical protein